MTARASADTSDGDDRHGSAPSFTVQDADDSEPIVVLDEEHHGDQEGNASSAPLLDSTLTEILDYAQGRLAAGEGDAALERLGATHPTLCSTYRLGYLPKDWQKVLGSTIRHACSGLRLADTIVLPAYDHAGNVVDILAIHPHGAYVGMRSSPCGLLAPAIATAHSSLTITDSFCLVARRFAAGATDVLLLRGSDDVRANAQRLIAAGVRQILVRVRTNAEAIATVLRSAGMEVAVVSAHPQSDAVGYEVVCPAETASTNDRDESGSTVPPLLGASSEAAAPPTIPIPAIVIASEPILVTHDDQSERATFTAGAITYVLEVPQNDVATPLELVIRHAGQVHREVLNLAVPAACTRFAGNAALRCGGDAAVILAHLPSLLHQVNVLARAQSCEALPSAVAVPPGEQRDDALQLLRSPDVLDRLMGDWESLGWIGEDDAKRILLLTAISRKLPEPLWSIRTASGACVGSHHELEIIAACTPPEDVVQVSRLSNAALAYQDADALRHKLFILDDATALSSEVLLALRVLRNRGALSQSIVSRHNLSGSARSRTIEVRGPLAVLSHATGRLDAVLSSACCLVPMDESSNHAARVLAAERRRYSLPISGNTVARRDIINRHHSVSRLLVPHPVVIPFAERIAFPATTLRHRGAQGRFLSLIAASALLHQHQRLSDAGHIVADIRDFTLAASLVEAASIGVEEDIPLGRPATALLAALRRAGVSTFTHQDVRALLPQWERGSFRSAVADLLRHEVIVSPDRGRGIAHRYELVPSFIPRPVPAITLRAATTDAGEGSWLANHQPLTNQLIPSDDNGIEEVG